MVLSTAKTYLLQDNFRTPQFWPIFGTIGYGEVNELHFREHGNSSICPFICIVPPGLHSLWDSVTVQETYWKIRYLWNSSNGDIKYYLKRYNLKIFSSCSSKFHFWDHDLGDKILICREILVENRIGEWVGVFVGFYCDQTRSILSGMRRLDLLALSIMYR